MFRKILLIFSFVLLAGCQDFDPMNGVKIIINYDLFETFVSFRFVDAETGYLIGTEDLTRVQARFEGKHGEAVLTQVGEHPEYISSVSGLVSIAINPFDPHTPTKETPVEFTLNASAPGFAESEYAVSISDTGYFTYVVIMPRMAVNPAYPSGFKLSLENLDSGIVDKSFEVVSPDNRINLKFPENTQFINQHGEISEKKLLLSVTNYPSFQSTHLKDKNILRVFDGNNETMLVIDPAALSQIELTSESGDTITQFEGSEKPVWQFIVPSRFKQKKFLKTWSLDSESQTWNTGQDVELLYSDSTCTAALTLNHLCYFVAGEESQTRELSGILDLSFEREFLTEQFSGEVLIKLNSSNEIIHRIKVNIHEGTLPINFYAPIDANINIQIRALNSDYEFASNPASLNISAEETSFQKALSLRPLKCPFSGTIKTHLQNSFPYYPIPARLRIRDTETQITYKTLNLLINENNDSQDFWFMLPENRHISCTLEDRSLANSFRMISEVIELNSSCSVDQDLDIELLSTSCLLQGTIKFERLGENMSSQVRLLVLRESDNRTIHNKSISFSGNTLLYKLELPIPEETPVKLIFQGVNQDDGLQFNPNEIILENPCENSVDTSVEFSSSLIQVTGSIIFTKDETLKRDPLPIKVAWMDWTTEEIIKQKSYTLSFSNPVIEYCELLEDKPLLMRVTRDDTDGLFVTDPFIFKIPDPKNAPKSSDVHLIKTNKQMIHAKLKVVCPAGEILPTIQGYYRIPGENWKELFILVGNLVMMAEMYATYEVGMILDEQMTDSTFTVTSNDIEMNFDLDPDDCEKMGWGK